jgi:hypothetical protein
MAMTVRMTTLAILAVLGACTPATTPNDNRQLLPARGGRVTGGEAERAVFGPFASLNDDCSVRALASVRIVQPPRNGVARVVLRQGQAAFTANNAFARCNGATIRGVFVDYTPNPGYAGPEAFRFEVVFADGERRVLSPTFTAR